MGKKGGSAPAPPDPKDTSSAQTGTNVSTALANAVLGNVNQVTPNGSLTYQKTGSTSIYDPYTKQTYEIPSYTATTRLSPDQLKLMQTGQGTSQNLADLAKSQSSFLKDYMNQPVDLSQVDNPQYQLYKQLSQPSKDQENERVQTMIRNRGITPGSTAYSQLQNSLAQSNSDADIQAQLKGRSQALNEMLTQRNQPLNEIASLMNGSAVQQPQFQNVDMPTIPTTNVADIIGQNYQQKLQAYQAQQAQQNGLFGGLFSLGSSLLGLFP